MRIYYIFFLVFFTACDSNHTDITKIDLRVSPNILKIAYLPDVNSTDDFVYFIDSNLTIGTVELLDEKTGRYSYISKSDIVSGNDRFSYNIQTENKISKNKQINIEIGDINVTINDIVQKNFTSNLPIVIIDTGDKVIPDDPKIKGSVTILEPDDTNRSNFGLTPTYSGYMEIEIRGSFSQFFPKKQYSIDTEDSNEEDFDVSILDMPVEHKWILSAPYSDKSLMRNYLAYTKTREINQDKYYAVRSKFVELLRREGEEYKYEGVYLFMEKIKRDKNRIDIKKLKNKDISDIKITGGYILQQDRISEDDGYIVGYNGYKYLIEYPKMRNIHIEQKNYIENYIWNFENSLYSDDYNESNSINFYSNWIDEDSFIVHILAREFFKDYDNWKYSEYFYKDRDSKLSLGPIWDFNMGMGNGPYNYGEQIKEWTYLSKTFGLGSWVRRLMADPAFQKKVVERWFELRSTIWSDSALDKIINDTKNLLKEASTRNFQRWPVLGTNVFFSNRKACIKNDIPIYCDTFESAVDEHLKVWLLERAKWMDKEFKNAL